MLVPRRKLKRLPLRKAAQLFIITSLAACSQARAGFVIDATLTDLADVVSGQDLWSASYSLSGASFQNNQGFSVLFPSTLYKNLSTPLAPTPPGWDVLSLQPDVALSAPGFLDGLALINNPLLLQPFKVNFTWLGTGTPGAQPFQTYDQAGVFQVTGTGQTVVTSGPMVPEPSTFGWGLCLVASSIWSSCRRVRSRV